MTTNSDISYDILSEAEAFLETLSSPLTAFAVRSDTQQQVVRPGQQVSKGRPVTVFLAYISDSEDDKLRRRIEGDLTTLKRQGLPITVIPYNINEALELSIDIEDPFKVYELFLFLLSPAFVQQEYCYSPQMGELITRHRKGVWVSPILLRDCLWEDTLFQRGNTPLPILPGYDPDTGSNYIKGWKDQDGAFKKVAEGVKRAVRYLKDHRIG